MTTIALGLTKPAKSKGGDRYDGETEAGETINIYVPQSISRPDNGKPVDEIVLTLEVG
jgi:hypothetical protein